MKVLVLSNCELEEKEIESGLKSLQEIVGGYIEIPFLSKVFNDYDIDIIINEEGKLIDGMNMEIAVVNNDGKLVDIVYGNCIFASHDEEGNTIGLNEKQMKIIEKELEDEIQLMDKNGNIHFMRALFI